MAGQRNPSVPADLPAEPDDLVLAFELAFAAGDLLAQGFERRQTVDRKGWRDLVSDADLASEELISTRLARERPHDGIHAEERSRREGTSGRRWVVDPLDGTTNFVHGHPIFCVSIALEEGGVATLGVIWAPYLGELFWAHRGRGGEIILAERPGKLPARRRPLAVTNAKRLGEALVATGFPYIQDERRNDNLGNFHRVSLAARGVRRGGSAALDLAYVACGRFDGFWELYLNPWDVSAGALMVEEAGGRVTDVRGTDDWRDGWEIVASNGRIHGELAACLEPADPRPMATAASR